MMNSKQVAGLTVFSIGIVLTIYATRTGEGLWPWAVASGCVILGLYAAFRFRG